MQRFVKAQPVSDTVVGVAEIAAHAGVKPDTVQQWRIRNLGFPPPERVLAMGPVWFLPVVEAWLEATGRRGDHAPN